MANTSRVIIVNYSMPVWGSLMAYFVLHERINARSAMGLALCVAGLGVLVYPVAETSFREPIGLLLAFVCALGWGGGTVYMKWARIKGDLLAITFWQVMVGVVVFAVLYLIFEGFPTFEPLQWRTWGGLLFNGILGTGIAYFIWFNIIGRLTHRNGVARLADQSRRRRHRRGDHSRRPPDRAGHDRLRADLQRRRLRDDPAAPRSRRPIRRDPMMPNWMHRWTMPSANSG